MTVEVRQFDVTIAAGVLKTAPATTALTLPVRVVEEVELEVRAGPSGFVGFYLAYNGQQVLPYVSGGWFVWDNTSRRYRLEDQPVGGQWQLVGYNTGNYAHIVTVRFHCASVEPARHNGPLRFTFVTEGAPAPEHFEVIG